MERILEEKIEPVKLFSTSSTPDAWDISLPPIIFIPGFFSTNRTFRGVRYRISTRTKRKIYTLELRNHGMSEYSEHFTLAHVLADLKGFMEKEDIPRAVLAGHSMGGRLALAMALKHPDMVEKVIVEDIPVVTNKNAIKEFVKSISFLKFLHRKSQELPCHLSEKEAQQRLLPHVAKFFPTVVKNFSDAKSPFLLPFHKDPSGQFVWEMNMDVVLGVQNHFDRFDIDLSSSPVFDGDTLLLAGECSLTRVQDDLDDFYKHFPKLECKVIPQGFHTYHVEFPELYVKLVSQFIGEDKE